MVPTSNISTVANSSNPTPAEIAQAQAILAQVAEPSSSTSDALDVETLTATQSETPLTEQHVDTVTADVQDLATPVIGADPADQRADTNDGQPVEVAQALPPIDPAKANTIRRLVEVAINSAFYMSNPKRVDALEASLKIPVSDDKSFSQFFVHSEKDLNVAAGRLLVKATLFLKK